MSSRTVVKSAITSALLCALFVVVYGATNWLTALRTDVGAFAFSWEQHIPFVPLMIVPYMSIDLFFAAAPFVCRDNRQRRVLARRIVAAILVAGTCFLLVPMRFSFERPHAAGWLGAVFDWFRGMDQPYNQFPSLHIALRSILAALYVERARGLLKWTLWVWFILIGLSTVLTWQHHLIDLAGGYVLGEACIHLFGEEERRAAVVKNFRIGVYYAIVSIALAALAVWLRSWAIVLLWPAGSAALMASGYFGLGPWAFGKTNGRLTWRTWLALWPILLAQRLSLVHYTRKCRRWDRLSERVWIGRKLNNAEADEAISAGVSAVVDLTCEFSETRPFVSLPYLSLPVLDLSAPTEEHLRIAADFIRRHAASGTVYVHCKVGYSRTAAVAGAYLLSTGAATSGAEAIAMLRDARPGIVIRPESQRAIESFAKSLVVDQVSAGGR